MPATHEPQGDGGLLNRTLSNSGSVEEVAFRESEQS
jgi:hypothetical protein